MRVAHFIQRYPPALGGSEAYFARLSRYLANRGDAVTVFTSTALDLEAFWSRRGAVVGHVANVPHNGVVVHRYPLARWPGRRYLLKALSLVPHRLWQCLTLPCNPICPGMWRDAGRRDVAFDVVHASAFPYAWPIACAWRLARRLDVPFVLTPFLHLGNPDDPADATRRGYTRPALRWLLRQADAVLVQTPGERAMALQLGVPSDRVHLQGLGVAPAECTGGDRSRARRQWRVPDHELVVGHLANQSREKGTIDLVRALEPLWREGRSLRLVLAGPEMPNFRAFWHDFQRQMPEAAATKICRLGVVSDAEKRNFFAGIDVFVLPSRSDSFGLVLLEAWANGVPNIAYRAGGVADVIRHQQDGLLVSCGDVQGLTGALAQLAVDASQRRRLGEGGRLRVLRDFAWGPRLELVRDLMAELVEKRQ